MIRYEVFDQRFPRQTSERDENGPIWSANFASVGYVSALDEAQAIALARLLCRNPSVRRVAAVALAA